MIEPTNHVKLPPPRHDGEASLEHTLRYRRSVREFVRGALTLAEIGQLLWAAQGITHPMGFRDRYLGRSPFPARVVCGHG